MEIESLFSQDIIMVLIPIEGEIENGVEDDERSGVEFHFKGHKIGFLKVLEYLPIINILDIYMLDPKKYQGFRRMETVTNFMFCELGEKDRLLHISTYNARMYPVGALTLGKYIELDTNDPEEKVGFERKYVKY